MPSSPEPVAARPAPLLPPPAICRPVIETTAPERYRVQFTVGKETHDKLRRLQALLRREIPDGDPGAIFDRAVTLLLAKVESRKMGVTAKPRESRSIRPGTDTRNGGGVESRDIPRYVKRAVREARWWAVRLHRPRRTAMPRTDLPGVPPHRPVRAGGRATVDNISLRCRRHNQYEAEIEFGASVMRAARGPSHRSPSATLAAAAPRTP
jgi:hypothetical protein